MIERAYAGEFVDDSICGTWYDVWHELDLEGEPPPRTERRIEREPDLRDFSEPLDDPPRRSPKPAGWQPIEPRTPEERKERNKARQKLEKKVEGEEGKAASVDDRRSRGVAPDLDPRRRERGADRLRRSGPSRILGWTPRSDRRRSWPSALVALGPVVRARRRGRRRRRSAEWLGQDGHDLVGGEPGPVEERLSGHPHRPQGAARRPRGRRGRDPGPRLGRVEDVEQGPVHRPGRPRAARSTSADLYFEPYQRETGREFEITLKLDDGQEAIVTIQGGKADPNLRAPGAGIEVKWLGQDGQDRTGPGPGVGPDGFEDVHLALARLSAKAEIKARRGHRARAAWPGTRA